MARHFRMIACEVCRREIHAAATRSGNALDLLFLPKGLHDIGKAAMSLRLQEAIGASSRVGCDALLLGYGLYNNGLCGLQAAVPMVVPRAHDCITLLMRSRRRFAEYFQDHPGTFLKSPGWIERDCDPNDNPASVTARLKISRNYRELAETYGGEMPSI